MADERPTERVRTLYLKEGAVRAAIARITADLTDARDRVASLEQELHAHKAVLTLFDDKYDDRFDPAEPPRTIRTMVRAVLDAGGASRISGIIADIQDAFGVAVVRTSMSPVLKKMELRGEVVHVGQLWDLKRDWGSSAPTDDPLDGMAVRPPVGGEEE